MIGPNFVAKTMMLVFAVPLLAHSGIKVDLHGLKHLLESRQQSHDIDQKQLQTAVQTLAVTVDMNRTATASLPGGDTPAPPEDAVNSAKMTQIMTNLNDLSKQTPP